MMRINRKGVFAVAALVLSLAYETGVSVVAGYDFGLRDIISPSWIEDLKPGRESATHIEFEAFEAEEDPEDVSSDGADGTGESPSIGASMGWRAFGQPLLQDLPPGFRKQLAYFLVFLLALFIYAFVGYRRNYNKVHRSTLAFKKVLDENFAFIANKPRYFQICTWTRYRVFASGRTSCNTLSIFFHMMKRQCPWHEWILSYLCPMEDYITLDFWLPQMDCVIFAITQKMTNKNFVEQHEEISHTMHVYDTTEVPNTHRCYINSKEKCVTNYASFVIALCQEFLPQLISLYIVDSVPEIDGYRKYQRIQVDLKFRDDMEWLEKVLKTMIHLVDFTKNYTVQDKTRELIEKNRQEMVTVLFKEEAKRADEEAKAEAAKNAVINPKKLEKKMMARPTQRIKLIR